jgi:ATP-binding cassette subfamily B protein
MSQSFRTTNDNGPTPKIPTIFKPYKWNILGGISFILISLSFGLLVPYFVGRAVDDLAAGPTWEKVIYYPLIILAVNAGSGVFLFLQRRFLINASRHIEFDMRQDFFNALVDQPLEYFQNTRVRRLDGSRYQ